MLAIGVSSLLLRTGRVLRAADISSKVCTRNYATKRQKRVAALAKKMAEIAKLDTILQPRPTWVPPGIGLAPHLRIPKPQARSTIQFPVGGDDYTDFAKVRTQRLSFFDKTEYIPLISGKKERARLLCRPKGFGKSLTVSMLRYFHGMEHKDKYNRLFKGLNVDKQVEAGPVEPNSFMVLHFDFSKIPPAQTLEEAARNFEEYLNTVVAEFIERYQEQGLELDKSQFWRDEDPAGNMRRTIEEVSARLQQKHQGKKETHKTDDPFYRVKGVYVTIDEYDHQAFTFLQHPAQGPWEETALGEVYGRFYENLNASRGIGVPLQFGLKMIYMTGTTPLILSKDLRGFSDLGVSNISWKTEYAGVLGLDREEVAASLDLIHRDEPEEEKQAILKELGHFAGHYIFFLGESKHRICSAFDTATILQYLDSHRRKKPETYPSASLAPSGVPKVLLDMCAAHPQAVKDVQEALAQRKIDCCDLPEFISLQDLQDGKIETWRAFMVYAGIMCFCQKKSTDQLVIPNRLAAGRAKVDILRKPLPEWWAAEEREFLRAIC